MKIKSRLFLCFTVLLILVSLTSCSGLFAGRDADSGTGRIVLDLGGARAVAPDIAEYGVYLVPVSGNRSAYENFMTLAMEQKMSTEEDFVPEGGILETGTNLKGSFEVDPGNWFVLVSANGTDNTVYLGFATTVVSKGQTSSVTIEMQTEEDLLTSPYAPNFSDTLYFMATEDTYSIQSGKLAFIPDTSVFSNLLQNIETMSNTGSNEFESMIQESLDMEENICYVLRNIHSSNGGVYADVIKVSFAGAPDSTYLSNVRIMYITPSGVQLDVAGTYYFLYSGQGLFDYIDWLLDSYLDSILNSLMDPEILETLEEFEDMEEYEALLAQLTTSPEPISSPIIAGTPASLEEINIALANFDWREDEDLNSNPLPTSMSYDSDDFTDSLYVAYADIQYNPGSTPFTFAVTNAYGSTINPDTWCIPDESELSGSLATVDSLITLDNFSINNGSLTADVRKRSFVNQNISTIESSVTIVSITEDGIFINREGGGRFLFTMAGLKKYVEEEYDDTNRMSSAIIISPTGYNSLQEALIAINERL